MKRHRSIEFVFVGLGQGGCRIAYEFSKLFHYLCLAINSAVVDLESLLINQKQKLHLDYGLDGAGKNLQFGESAILENRELILDFLRLSISKVVNFIIICVGGGGGTGSGGLIHLIDIARELGKSIGVIYTLPLDSEDTTTKKNSIATLRLLSAQAEISPIIIIDNAKISKNYPNLSITHFWPRANQDIAYIFHIFNMLSSQSSPLHSFDMADYQMTLRAGGCMVMGMTDITDYHHKEVLAEQAKLSVSKGLLADGFDLSTAQRAGIILRGPAKVLRHIKATDLDYTFNYIREVIGAGSIYRGVYPIEGKDDRLQVFSIFGGLDLPRERIGLLIDETKRELEIVSRKKSLDLTLDEDFGEDTPFDEENGEDPLLKYIRDKKTSKRKKF